MSAPKLYTVGPDTGDPDEYTDAELVWLAGQHALEASRLVNECVLANIDHAVIQRTLKVASVHAEVAQAIAATLTASHAVLS